MKQFRDLRRRDGGENDNQERNGGNPREEARQNQKPAEHFEVSHKKRGETRMGKSNSCEAEHAHVRVPELENSLREKDQPDGNA